ncbi:Domain of uncharacterised function (DUF892) [Leclercia adecarboxylata]|uniref:Domain of uncharacterized function (DUF892) n=1 Tax=Leclercia adecarboxylata TaxID=83655 RepID=A0A4U9ICP8_9ENTR|nr:Domain of uncharacterised function (DUF892) [Leclercia adecarboxylata]
MNHVEHYHDWLRDAHAMEKQAESMLESMASRIDNYPDVRARIEQHITETKQQITVLEEILDRNDISRSMLKDSMSKMMAFGQSVGGMVTSDEIVKGSISGYVFEQFEIAVIPPCWPRRKKPGTWRQCLLSSLSLRKKQRMADWLIQHIPDTTEQFLLRSDADGVEAKK